MMTWAMEVRISANRACICSAAATSEEGGDFIISNNEFGLTKISMGSGQPILSQEKFDGKFHYFRGTNKYDPMDITLKEAQEKVDNWIRTYGLRYFSELTNLGILLEEAGELARIMVRKYGDQSAKENEDEGALAEEMADILWVLFCLA